MGEISEIKKQVPNQKLVEQCERLLRDARSGEIQAIAGCLIYDSGCSSEFWVNSPQNRHIKLDSDRMIGCFERMKFQIIATRHSLEVPDSWDR